MLTHLIPCHPICKLHAIVSGREGQSLSEVSVCVHVGHKINTEPALSPSPSFTNKSAMILSS